MIIQLSVTCGMVLGDKYLYFKRQMREEKLSKNEPDDVIYLTIDNIKKHLKQFV